MSSGVPAIWLASFSFYFNPFVIKVLYNILSINRNGRTCDSR